MTTLEAGPLCHLRQHRASESSRREVSVVQQHIVNILLHPILQAFVYICCGKRHLLVPQFRRDMEVNDVRVLHSFVLALFAVAHILQSWILRIVGSAPILQRDVHVVHHLHLGVVPAHLVQELPGRTNGRVGAVIGGSAGRRVGDVRVAKAVALLLALFLTNRPLVISKTWSLLQFNFLRFME